MTENDVNLPINNDPMEKRNEFIDHPSYLSSQAYPLHLVHLTNIVALFILFVINRRSSFSEDQPSLKKLTAVHDIDF